MRTNYSYWGRLMTVHWSRSSQAIKCLGWTAMLAAAGMFPLAESLAQVNIGGSGGTGVQVGSGGGTRVSGGTTTSGSVRAGTSGTVRTAPNAGVRTNVSPSVRATVPNTGVRANVTAPNTGVRANVTAPNTGVRANVTAPNTGARANVNPSVSGSVNGRARVAPNAAVRANANAPNTGVGANVGVPNTGVGANVNVPNTGVGANINAPNAAVGANVNAPNTGVGANINTPNANVGTNVNPSVSGAAGATAGTGNIGAATTGQAGANLGANVNAAGAGAQAGAATTAQGTARTAPKWRTATPQQLAKVQTNLNSAIKSSATTNATATGGTSGSASVNPQRAAYMAGWANGVRSGYYYGGSPFFGGSPFYNQGFWTGRNLIGLGISAATGTPYGYSGGYGGMYGGLGGGWWGYSPWLGYQPWSYWWGTPAWNGINTWTGYGWNSPYYYDYGPGGTVVYQGNQVLVNGQTVGTSADYAQTAAELATIDANMIANVKPEDWMPLGTFSMAISTDESNPSRVLQLALSKQGLISGTVFNRNSGNTYTVQGRVDKDTQRVAFTIGDQKDTVFETGLFNLTQQEANLLVHFGPTQTQNYLIARLPPPESGTQATQSAAVPQPEIAR
jgi:hypothetical protein